MRELYMAPMPQGDAQFRQWVQDVFAEIMRASIDDADVASVARDFTVSNFTALRTIDASTATTADLANAFCTFIDDIKNKGMKG